MARKAGTLHRSSGYTKTLKYRGSFSRSVKCSYCSTCPQLREVKKNFEFSEVPLGYKNDETFGATKETVDSDLREDGKKKYKWETLILIFRIESKGFSQNRNFVCLVRLCLLFWI